MSEKQSIAAKKRALAIPKEEMSKRMSRAAKLRWMRMTSEERREQGIKMRSNRKQNVGV